MQSFNKKIKNATKVELGNGLVAASRLEGYLYNRLQQLKIPFDFQYEVVLQEGFRDNEGVKIRPIAIIVDFHLPGYKILADTKGFQLADNKLKVKMLKLKMVKEYPGYRFVLLCNKKKVDEFVLELIGN